MYESGFVQLEQINLHVLEEGNPEDPLVVFLHGFPEYNGMWLHQLDYFSSKGYFAVAPDMRGYNLSEKPEAVADYQVHVLANDVKHLIRYYRKEKAVVVGHDLGGMVAWHLGIVFPEIIEKVVVINMPHLDVYRHYGLRNLVQLAKSWYVFFFQLPYIPEKLAELTDYKILANSIKTSAITGAFSEEDLESYIEAWKHEDALHTMIHVYRAALRYPFDYSRYQGGRVPVPLRLIWGQKDHFLLSSLAEYSMDLCDKGELEFFEEATHWIVKEMPGLINKCILEFLGRP